MQPIPPEKGPSFRQMQKSYELMWRERLALREEVGVLEANNARLVAELNELRRSKQALGILVEALKKRLAWVTSASRSSTSSVEPQQHQHLPAKRPLPPGVIHEEKTKKMATEVPPPSSRP